jgi:hypothetical protein
MRKLMLLAIVGLGAGVGGFALSQRALEGRAEAGQTAQSDKSPYVHTVIFYLKKDAPATAANGMIKDAHGLLAKIDSVRGVWAGKPADMSSPNVAVKDYHVGLLVLFDNFQGLEKYLKDPLHDEYLARHKGHIEKVLVYDFVNQK